MRQGSEPDKPQQKLPIRRQAPKAERLIPLPSPRMEELSFMSNEEIAGPLSSEVGPSGSGGGPGNEAPDHNNAQEEEIVQHSENDVSLRFHRRVEMEEISDFMGAAHQGLSTGLHQRGESHNDVQEEEAVQQSTKPAAVGKYELQKRRDWNIFGQYLKDKSPPVDLAHCNGVDVVAFLQHHDQFGKTKVHLQTCPLFGLPSPPGSCECPLRQAWGSLDALVGRLRAAFEENGGMPEFNPFGARVVRQYLRDIRDNQAKARGISYDKKRKRPTGVADSDDHQQLQQQLHPPSEVQGLGLGIGTPTGAGDSDEQQQFDLQHEAPSEVQGLVSGVRNETGGADTEEASAAPIFF